MLKQLSSFMAMSINGGDRVSFTYDEIDPDTGEPTSTNKKQSFYVVDEELRSHIDAIRKYIRDNKLSEE